MGACEAPLDEGVLKSRLRELLDKTARLLGTGADAYRVVAFCRLGGGASTGRRESAGFWTPCVEGDVISRITSADAGQPCHLVNAPLAIGHSGTPPRWGERSERIISIS